MPPERAVGTHITTRTRRPGITPGLFIFLPNHQPNPNNNPHSIMAIKLIANYSKRLGLPGYSSHQFSFFVDLPDALERQ